MTRTKMDLGIVKRKTVAGADHTAEIARQITRQRMYRYLPGTSHTAVWIAGIRGLDRTHITDRSRDLRDSCLSRRRIRTFLKNIIPVQPRTGMMGWRTAMYPWVAGSLPQSHKKNKKQKQGLSPESRQEIFHNRRYMVS